MSASPVFFAIMSTKFISLAPENNQADQRPGRLDMKESAFYFQTCRALRTGADLHFKLCS